MADRPERKLTTRELLQQLPRALTLVWEASRTNALLLSGLTLVQAVLPAAMAWVGKLIIDAVVVARRCRPKLRRHSSGATSRGSLGSRCSPYWSAASQVSPVNFCA